MADQEEDHRSVAPDPESNPALTEDSRGATTISPSNSMPSDLTASSEPRAQTTSPQLEGPVCVFSRRQGDSHAGPSGHGPGEGDVHTHEEAGSSRMSRDQTIGNDESQPDSHDRIHNSSQGDCNDRPRGHAHTHDHGGVPCSNGHDQTDGDFQHAPPNHVHDHDRRRGHSHSHGHDGVPCTTGHDQSDVNFNHTPPEAAHDHDHHHHHFHQTRSQRRLQRGWALGNWVRGTIPNASDSSTTISTVSTVPSTTLSASFLTDKDRIKIGVREMGCSISCCDGRSIVLNALRNVPGITNPVVTVNPSVLTLSLDENLLPISALLTTLRERTAFQFYLESTGGYQLEVMEPDDREHLKLMLEDDKYPRGVESVTPTGERTLLIRYDPQKSGARDILKSFSDIPDIPDTPDLILAALATDTSIAEAIKALRHLGITTFLAGICTTFVFVLAQTTFQDPADLIFDIIKLTLALFVQCWLIIPVYKAAWKAAKHSKKITMDVLVSCSTTIAFGYSVVAFIMKRISRALKTGMFFETSTMVAFFILLGKWFTAHVVKMGRSKTPMGNLQDKTAVVLMGRDGHGEEIWERIDTRLLHFDDVFRVEGGERIPTDGQVTKGESAVDESMMSGESAPVRKKPGSNLVAGTTNLHHSSYNTTSPHLEAKVTALIPDNSISQVTTGLVGSDSRPPIETLIDSLAGTFVVVIILIFFITLLIWSLVNHFHLGFSVGTSVANALPLAISVLIVACPCAIGLAAPLVVHFAVSEGEKMGLVMKNPGVLEVAGDGVTHVVFDKTGTLTESRMEVRDWAHDPELWTPEMESIILGLLSGEKHPVSVTVAGMLMALDTNPAEVAERESIPGYGVQGSYQGKTLRFGNVRWLNAQNDPKVGFMTGGSQALSVAAAEIDGEIVAVFGLEDTIRPESAHVVGSLISKGIFVSIVSGDSQAVVEKVAAKLGIRDKARILGDRLPAQKKRYVEDLVAATGKAKTGKNKEPVVMFVGDGTNDTGALHAATIGVHLSSGTDAARAAADVVILNSNLGPVLTLMDIAKATQIRIWLNVGFSVVYNVLAISWAAGVFNLVPGGFSIPPGYAAFGELVSLLPVLVFSVSMKLMMFTGGGVGEETVGWWGGLWMMVKEWVTRY